ncbi:MAG TPA: hypothetical protein VKH41_05175 [Myxococcota bacterium]|nr:hypothetical protein [Myxococcota bacterium]
MGFRSRALLWLPLLLLASGCGQTFVLTLPDVPALASEIPELWRDKPPPPPPPAASDPAPTAPPTLGECPFMTVMIDYSREGNAEVGARVANAMTEEFKALGTHVTRSSGEAYWSLMILASENSRRDGFVFSAMFSARNMNESYDPGVTVFQRNGSRGNPGGHAQKIPTLYNGLVYGPYAVLEDQARSYVRQAYTAVYPFAQRLCAYDAADRKREQSIDDQLPAGPAPL